MVPPQVISVRVLWLMALSDADLGEVPDIGDSVVFSTPSLHTQVYERCVLHFY